MTMQSVSHERRLDALADVAVRVGLGLVPGQQLIVTAPIEALPLARRVTEQAYKAGASLVTTFFADEECVLHRYQHAADGSFDCAAGWLFDGIAAALRNGAARLTIGGDNPALLARQDPGKVDRANRAFSQAYRPVLELIAGFATNWTIVPYATASWARMVFPADPMEIAIGKLWDAIFVSTRVDRDDPVAAWQAHARGLAARTRALNESRHAALHFRGPGTDLRIGLADDHLWVGGAATAGNGATCHANIPSEEVFTTPHRNRVDGFATSTKPLAHRGTLITDLTVSFSEGAIVEAKARTGEQVLQRLLNRDPGARRLGEVALVPHSSPIAQSGLLFYNTLFDENAASHVALGESFRKCVRGGEGMSEEDFVARGANRSLIHVDWMIGSPAIDVDGIAADGTCEPLMRGGEWIS
jgi:aminopeptidase